MSHSPSPARSLTTAVLVAGAVVVPSTAALAIETEAVSKAQVEYSERHATQDKLPSNKAQIEYHERMAQRRDQAPSTSTSPDPAGLPIGAVVGLIGLGAAVAGSTVLVIRHQQARPRTT